VEVYQPLVDHVATRGPIARKLLSSLKQVREATVVSLDAQRAAKANAAEILRSAKRPGHADVPPAFAVAAFVHNYLVGQAELILELPAMKQFRKRIERADEEYMPSAPPMSPIMSSYFWSWALYDLGIGAERETIGQCILAVNRTFGMSPDFVAVAEHLVTSRLGMFVRGKQLGADLFALAEVVTGRDMVAVSASGHVGEPGELWLVRVLPPPLPELREHVVFGTPYVVRSPHAAAWHAYLDRAVTKVVTKDDVTTRYERLMKRGPTGESWHEYIFEAYSNHTAGAVFLRGVPDIDESRPHSRVSERLADEDLAPPPHVR